MDREELKNAQGPMLMERRRKHSIPNVIKFLLVMTLLSLAFVALARSSSVEKPKQLLSPNQIAFSDQV